MSTERGRPKERSSSQLLLLAGLAAAAPLADEHGDDQRDDRHDVQQLREPVAGVSEHGHRLPSDSSQRPKLVKPTITASIQYCERTANRWSPNSTIPQSCATT